MYRLTTTLPRTRRFLSTRLPSQSRHSSGSPLPGQQSPEHFTKTGEKPQEPDEFSARSYEYSQSGGDDMVAAQGGASFSDSKDTDPLSEKTTAGKGNVVNPLELSPATTELSKCFPDTDVSQAAEREVGAKTGQGISKKAKTVKKDGIDYQPDYRKKTSIPSPTR